MLDIFRQWWKAGLDLASPSKSVVKLETRRYAPMDGDKNYEMILCLVGSCDRGEVTEKLLCVCRKFS